MALSPLSPRDPFSLEHLSTYFLIAGGLLVLTMAWGYLAAYAV